MSKPQLPVIALVIFAVHVTVSNFAYVALSELHWFRVWLFGSDDAIRLQQRSISTTALVWTLLAIIGLCASLFSSNVGVGGIVDLLHAPIVSNPIMHFVFWMAGCAALFATSDALVYGVMLVKAYNPVIGKIRDDLKRPTIPFRSAIIAAASATALFLLVEIANIPFEKIVFIVAPIFLNLLPAAVDAVTRPSVNAWPVVVASVMYMTLSIIGLLQPANQLTFTLAAALAPGIIAMLRFLTRPLPKKHTSPDYL